MGDADSDKPNENRQLILPDTLHRAGLAANRAAAHNRFVDYRSRRAYQTLRRQDADLSLFKEFLNLAGIEVGGNFSEDPASWAGITWGLVEAFVKWQISEGYAIPSINVRLSTVKTYAKLAFQAGSLSPEEYSLIHVVQGYSRREKTRIDQKRPVQRVGLKKEVPVLISPEQAAALKHQGHNNPQQRRDTFMMSLLLDHGLRVGEVVNLKVMDIDPGKGLLRFFRPKVNKIQVHKLSRDTLTAYNEYQKDLLGSAPSSPLLRRSLKNKDLGQSGMTERAITQRVNYLGKTIGLMGLSAHDCRHFWATSAARSGTDPFVLQQAGGWSSLAMPRRYVEDNDVSNEGIILDNDD